MKRRDFISINLQKKKKYSDAILSLEKYAQPLDRQTASHLLKRTTFGPTPELLDEFIGLSVDEAVEKILGDGTKPAPDGNTDMDWLNTQEENPLSGLPIQIRTSIEAKHLARYKEFKTWWLKQMRNEIQPFAEKLTLFWSTVWTIEFTYDTLSLIPPPLIYRNNQQLRRNRMGDYKSMTFDNTMDGAMLLYQSVNFSTKDAPNENFPRELLELFTMGIGHYTEGDIRESSRILTGWRTAAHLFEPKPNGEFNTYFVPSLHDIGSKTYFGEVIPARNEAQNTEEQVKNEEVHRMLNILFEQRPMPIARFICEKIYNYFVYSNPGEVNEAILTELSQVFIDNNFELRPVFEKLFKSQHFYDDSIIGCQIKTPPEFIVGLERQLNVEFKAGERSLASDACDALEQELYDPPNVGSWKAYRTWISTKTYPLRRKFADDILALASNNDLIALVKRFDNYNDFYSFFDDFLLYFLPRPLLQERYDFFVDLLLNNFSPENWGTQINNNSLQAAQGIRNFIKEIILSPDFHLI